MKVETFDANLWANFKRNIFLKFLQSEILSQPQIFLWFVQMLFSGPSLMLLNVVLLQWAIHDTTLWWMFGTSLEISITKSSIVLNLDDLYRLKNLRYLKWGAINTWWHFWSMNVWIFLLKLLAYGNELHFCLGGQYCYIGLMASHFFFSWKNFIWTQ